MKKILVIAVCILLVACNSDDSDSPSPNNAPSGALIRVETYYLLTDFYINTTNFFDANGRITSSHTETSINSSYNTEYLYNQEGQIWKIIYDNGSSEEYYFTDNLISSSISLGENDVKRRQYSYNSLNQLSSIQYFYENNIEVGTYDITYNNDGNIVNTYFDKEDGSFTEYTYEYDNHNNPHSTLFNNQEIGKIMQHNLNNKTKRLFSGNIGTNIFTREYTYNDADYPISSNEYNANMDGDLVTQVTFFYQE